MLKIHLKIHQIHPFFCFRIRICFSFILVVHTGLCIQNFFSGFADYFECMGFTYSLLIEMPWDTWRHAPSIYLYFLQMFPVRILVMCIRLSVHIPSVPFMMTVHLTVFGIQSCISITSACLLSDIFSLLYVSVITVFICVVCGSFKWSVHLLFHWIICWHHQWNFIVVVFNNYIFDDCYDTMRSGRFKDLKHG